jgi:hypothetical protein
MTDFYLDGEERFHENCTAFLASVKEIDPEMAAILESNCRTCRRKGYKVSHDIQRSYCNSIG